MSSHTYNRKNNFLILGKGATDGINNSTGAAKKNSINFSKAKQKFSLRSHYNGDESYLYVNEVNTFNFKANDNISWYEFSSGSVSKDFTKDEHKLSVKIQKSIMYTKRLYLESCYM